jgi:hypothetical protein
VKPPGRPTAPADPRARLALTALACLLALGACGDDTDSEDSAEPVGQELGGSVAQLVQCRDWVAASDEQKLATIADIRSQVNREDAGVTASELTDEEAMEVFDNGCDEPAAAGYRLHVMYARAAAFKPLREIAEGTN